MEKASAGGCRRRGHRRGGVRLLALLGTLLGALLALPLRCAAEEGPSPAAAQSPERERRGRFAELLLGLGQLDPCALGGPGGLCDTAAQSGASSFTTYDLTLRAGYRGGSGLSPTLELRAGAVSTQFAGDRRPAFAALTGLAWAFPPASADLSLRAAVRGGGVLDDGTPHAIVAFSVGAEVPLSLGALTLELSIERGGADATAFRVGVMSF